MALMACQERAEAESESQLKFTLQPGMDSQNQDSDMDSQDQTQNQNGETKQDSNALDYLLPSKQSACDACWKRKVRCDKLSPCSSCKASDLPCRNTRARPGRRPRHQRGQASNRQQQTIADLQAKVERLSESLTARAEATNATFSPTERPERPSSSSAAATPPCNALSRRQSSPHDRDSSFEGDSSFMVHSKQVTQAFKASLVATPQLNVDDALFDAVATLQKVLDSNPTRIPSAHCSRDTTYDEEGHGLSALPLPPSNLVLKLLKRAKVEPRKIFDEAPGLDLPTIISCCQKVFFAMEPYSIATFVIVNTSLLFLLRTLTDQAKLDIQVSQADVIHYLDILPKNVDVALRKLPLVAPHSTENITALHLACSLAVESSIEASPWDLISTAARMALSAGYHRLQRRPGDNEGRLKRITFWSIYAMDRSMALSLGRAPNIQDFDIQTDRLAIPEDMDSAIGPMLVNWVEMAKLQGEIYHQLYSAHAQNQPLEGKVVAAKQLAECCLELNKGFQESDMEDLALLGEFVSTLRSAAEQSSMVRKLYNACNSFHEIAKAFVAGKSKHLPSSGLGTHDNRVESQSVDAMAGEVAFQPWTDGLLSQQDWDLMLNDWDLGLGTLEARQMSSYLDLLPNT
ncbi:MAG: hypothetical protein Q9174_002911 [Haloplaca sp. 1 TL-2023]